MVQPRSGLGSHRRGKRVGKLRHIRRQNDVSCVLSPMMALLSGVRLVVVAIRTDLMILDGLEGEGTSTPELCMH
jgi:hypothetical protein